MSTVTITICKQPSNPTKSCTLNRSWEKFADATKTVVSNVHEVTKELTKKVQKLEKDVQRLEEEVVENKDEISILRLQNNALRKQTRSYNPIEFEQTQGSFEKATTNSDLHPNQVRAVKKAKVERVPTPIPVFDYGYKTPEKIDTSIDASKRYIHKPTARSKHNTKKLKEESSTALTRSEEV